MVARIRPAGIVIGAFTMSVLAGLVIATPVARFALGILAFAIVAVAAMTISPHSFVGAAVIVFGTQSVSQSHPFLVGPITVYTTDVLLALLLFRALLPKPRRPVPRIATPFLVAAVGLYALSVLYAGYRGYVAGNTLGQIARSDTSAIYLLGFSWGFFRLATETAMDVRHAARITAIVGTGFVGFAIYTRVVGQHFDSAQLSTGTVVTSAGYLRRDYGLFTAFQLYPLLALAGLAVLFFATQTRRRYVVAVTVIALAATTMTLVRGMIFGLAAGATVLLMLALHAGNARIGARTVPLVAGVALLAIPFAMLQPSIAGAVAQRVLPGVLPQTANADRNTEYRLKVLASGREIARQHAFGLGFVDEYRMAAAGYQPIFLPHSMWAALLALEGWPGAALFALMLLATVLRSRRLPASEPWLHPLVVAAAVLAVVEGFGWNLLFSMVSGMGMVALIVGLRFGLTDRTAEAPRVASTEFAPAL